MQINKVKEVAFKRYNRLEVKKKKEIKKIGRRTPKHQVREIVNRMV